MFLLLSLLYDVLVKTAVQVLFFSLSVQEMIFWYYLTSHYCVHFIVCYFISVINFFWTFFYACSCCYSFLYFYFFIFSLFFFLLGKFSLVRLRKVSFSVYEYNVAVQTGISKFSALDTYKADSELYLSFMFFLDIISKLYILYYLNFMFSRYIWCASSGTYISFSI